jgi:anti-anti-sigma factor
MEWARSDFRTEMVSEGSSIVVQVVGEVDITTAPSLQATLELASMSTARVVVDMSRVAFIDAAGITALLTSASLAQANRGELVVRNLSATARRVFDILSMSRCLPLEDEAAASSALPRFDLVAPQVSLVRENEIGVEIASEVA